MIVGGLDMNKFDVGDTVFCVHDFFRSNNYGRRFFVSYVQTNAGLYEPMSIFSYALNGSDSIIFYENNFCICKMILIEKIEKFWI